MNQAIQAIDNRNPDALAEAFNSLEEAAQFRNEVLPSLSPDDCRWFWQQVMDPDQLERTLSAVRDTCIAIAKELDLAPGKEYSLGSLEGLPTMVLTASCCERFYDRFPKERWSVLRFYLQCIEE